ncbi:hypothetical protein ACTJJY_31715 [Bacillus sp. 22475]
MQEVQIRKNAVGAIIHNDIKNYPYVNYPPLNVLMDFLKWGLLG